MCCTYAIYRTTYYPFLEKSFKTCFKAVLKDGKQVSSPCSRPVQIQDCTEYCDWHQHFITTTKSDEFLTLMKYGLPQRKWMSDSISQVEKKLSLKLHGESNVNFELTPAQTPVPFSVLCERRLGGKKEIGFIGENVGWLEPVCNQFFPTPTNQGICMTENFNIQEVLHGYEKYDQLMESSQQSKVVKKIDGGTIWGRKTFVITAQSQPSQKNTVNFKKDCKIRKIVIIFLFFSFCKSRMMIGLQ